MAKVLYGGLITELKGKLGGTVFQSGRYGTIARNKPAPFKQASEIQGRLRGVILTVSKAWRTIAQAQRDAFDVIAPSWPALDAFGNPMLLTGYNVFCKLNFWNLNLGGVIDPVASLPAALWQPVDIALDIAVGAVQFDVSFLPTPIDTATTVILYASSQVSAGRSLPPAFMKAIGIIPVTTASPFDATAFYLKHFGTFPTAGNKVFIALQSVSNTNGTPGPLQYQNSIVLV